MDALSKLKMTIGSLVVINTELEARNEELAGQLQKYQAAEALAKEAQKKFDEAVDAKDEPSGASNKDTTDSAPNNL